MIKKVGLNFNNLKRFLSQNKFSLFGIITLIILSGCSSISNKTPQSNNEVALPVYNVDTGSIVLTKSYLGTVEGKIDVEIRPQVTGELIQSYVDEGDYVNKGQKLFKINTQTYQQDLNQALANKNVQKAKLANAKLEIERLKPLVANEVMSPVKLDKAKSDYKIAQSALKQASAAVASAKIQLSYTTIEAPVSGYIGRIPKRIGNLVSPGDSEPITVLTDVHEVYVYFSISEGDFYDMLKSQSSGPLEQGNFPTHIDTNKVVSLILSDGTKYPLKGVIDASSGHINKNTGAILLRANFPNNDNLLRSGNTGTIILKQKKHGKVIIPQKATFQLQTNVYVKKLTPDNRIVRQIVTIGTAFPESKYTITKGLKAGDRILVEGLSKVQDSTLIKPMPYTPDTLMAPEVIPGEDSSTGDSL